MIPIKIKHYVQFEELIKFVNYLKTNKDNIIFEILYKFGIRVGAIEKLKIEDFAEDGTIIFNEKNNKIIKRK